MSAREIRAIALAACALAAACADKDALVLPSAASTAIVRFDLQRVLGAELTATGKSVDVYVGYDRLSGERVPLAHSLIDFDAVDADTGATRDVALTVDIGPCVADANRAGTREGCTLRVTLAVRNASAILLDSLDADPVDVSGRSTTTSEIEWHSDVASAISAGDQFTCMLTNDGAAYCWGVNSSGQLGNGSTAASNTPVAVSGGLRFIALDAGTSTVCAITAGHKAYCWGGGINGQLGDSTSGSGRQSTTPVAVFGNQSFQSISVGNASACAIDLTDAAFCWGRNGTGIGGQYGALGTGDTTSVAIPTAVSGGLKFRSVGVGLLSTCGLTTAGQAYCWGSNTWRSIGVSGTTSQFLSPTPVEGGLLFATLGTGAISACGVTAAGAAYCWGTNAMGTLGNSTTGSLPQPTAVAVSGSTVFDVVLPSGANTFLGPTCGISLTRSAFCWGPNKSGQLGTTATLPASCTQGVTFGCTGVPTAVQTSLTFRAISTGGEHACGITIAHTVVCWGLNTVGQLGDGSNTSRSTPAAIAGALKTR